MKPRDSIGITDRKTRELAYSQYIFDDIDKNLGWHLKYAQEDARKFVCFITTGMTEDHKNTTIVNLTKNGYAFKDIDDLLYVFIDRPGEVDMDKEIYEEQRWRSPSSLRSLRAKETTWTPQ